MDSILIPIMIVAFLIFGFLTWLITRKLIKKKLGNLGEKVPPEVIEKVMKQGEKVKKRVEEDEKKLDKAKLERAKTIQKKPKKTMKKKVVKKSTRK